MSSRRKFSAECNKEPLGMYIFVSCSMYNSFRLKPFSVKVSAMWTLHRLKHTRSVQIKKQYSIDIAIKIHSSWAFPQRISFFHFEHEKNKKRLDSTQLLYMYFRYYWLNSSNQLFEWYLFISYPNWYVSFGCKYSVWTFWMPKYKP